jgi:hypothetical protein
MPFLSMEQGIKAIQAGNRVEGARLLRIALKSDQLTGRLRAVTLLWLAETSDDRDQKIACYKDALVADPGNPDAQHRLAVLMAAQLPPTPPPQVAAPPPPTRADTGPLNPNYAPVTGQTPLPGQMQPMTQTGRPGTGALGSGVFYRTLGVLDGPNGPATAFFVNPNGLLATSRFAVGGVENVTIALDGARSTVGQIVRAFPDLDVALIYVDIVVSKLLPTSPSPTIPDNMALTAISHNGRAMSGNKPATKRDLGAQWFPTTIRELADAGGNPVFDDRNYLVGMLTHNMSRTSGYVFGLHITAIYKCVDHYLHETRLDANRVYCPNCGFLSRAPNFGAFYCEICGSVLPFARDSTRFPMPQADTFYGENMHTACRHCGSRLGYYNGRCLRCGNELNPSTKK